MDVEDDAIIANQEKLKVLILPAGPIAETRSEPDATEVHAVAK